MATPPRRALAGPCFVAVGILHTVVGLVSAWPVLAAVAGDGWVGRWTATPERQLVLWYFTTGFALMLAGLLLRALERASLPVPWLVIAGLLVVSLGGVLAVPVSGFWLVLAATILAAAERTALDRRRRSLTPAR